MPSKKLLFAMVFAIVLFCLTWLFFTKMLPAWAVRDCIQGQYDEIYRINDLIRRARDTGDEYLEPFRLRACTKCIWFNSSESTLKIIFYQEKEPVSIPVELGWGASKDFDSREKALNVPGFTYRFRITRVGIEECFNCEDNTGKCEVS